MKTETLPIEKLVPHESAVTRERTSRVPATEDAPLVVKPLPATDYYYIYQGHNRAWKAMHEGRREVTVVVAPPDYMERRNALAQRSIDANPTLPLKRLALVDSDFERQNRFFLDNGGLSRAPRINTHRGTMLRLVVSLDDREGGTFETVVLPQKGGWGAIILHPELLGECFRAGAVDIGRVASSWGDDGNHDPNVLPAYIELGSDGTQCRAGGFALDVSFYHGTAMTTPPAVSRRPQVVQMRALVLYPDGNIWEGTINATHDNAIAVLWDDSLILQLADEEQVEAFFALPRWWRTPTSAILHLPEPGKASSARGCANIEHTCGSTCSGGGCAI